MKTAALVCLENLGTDLGQNIKLLIGNGHEVNCFGLEGVDSTSVNQVESQEDEVTEFLGLNTVNQ